MIDSIVKYKIDPLKIRALLIYSVIVLVILSLFGLYLKYFLRHGYVKGFVPMFNLDEENNIPTYFSSLLLLTASCLLYIISTAKKKTDDIYAKHWFYLSITFLLLSIDEAASIHELLIMPLRRALNLSGVLFFSWVLVGFVVVIIIAALYLRFVLELPRKMKISFIIAATLYIGGALGFELIGGDYISNHGDEDLIYGLITTIEEALEIIGVVIFIQSLIEYLSTNKYTIQISLTNKNKYATFSSEHSNQTHLDSKKQH